MLRKLGRLHQQDRDEALATTTVALDDDDLTDEHEDPTHPPSKQLSRIVLPVWWLWLFFFPLR